MTVMLYFVTHAEGGMHAHCWESTADACFQHMSKCFETTDSADVFTCPRAVV